MRRIPALSGAALLLLLAALSFAARSATGRIIVRIGPPDVTVTMTATESKFEPAEFTVPAGKQVRVVIVNRGKRRHAIRFDLGGKMKFSSRGSIAPGRTGMLQFESPAPGTYAFTSPVGRDTALGMTGRMTVTEG